MLKLIRKYLNLDVVRISKETGLSIQRVLESGAKIKPPHPKEIDLYSQKLGVDYSRLSTVLLRKDRSILKVFFENYLRFVLYLKK